LILQHPSAAPLKLAIGAAEKPDPPSHVFYKVNTEGGSSGSPCLNQRLETTALHHQGESSRNRGVTFEAIREDWSTRRDVLEAQGLSSLATPPIGGRPDFGQKKGSQASPSAVPVNPQAGRPTPQDQSSITPARDIQRYLADGVVEARPPSAGTRLRELVRRHKGQVLAASLVLLALVAGVIGTSRVPRVVASWLGGYAKGSGSAGSAAPDPRRDGAFDFPQAQATVLCDEPDLRVSAWNDASYLYIQAILWKDDNDALDKSADGRPIGDWGALSLDVDADGKVTPERDLEYCLNPWVGQPGPYCLPGLHYSKCVGG
jgi:hypothetical protein